MEKPLKFTIGNRDYYQAPSYDAVLSFVAQKERTSDLRTIPDFPLALHVEVTSFCDNDCIFCARGDMKRENSHMDETLFKKIIDECAYQNCIGTLYLYHIGDPILNPKLPEYIRYAKEKKAAKNIAIATSANALTPELSKKIIESGLDEISFSVDALTYEKYRHIKGTENYARVLKNILDFVRIREDLHHTNPRITIKMLAIDEVIEDIDFFVRLWINIADQVLIDREISSWDGTNKRTAELLKNMKCYTRKEGSIRYPCNRPWYWMAINAKGKVILCSEDWDEKMIMGDVTKDSIYDIWHGDKYNFVKKCHIDAEWDKLPPCKSCDAHYERNIGNWFRENKEIALKRNKHKE